MWGSESSVALLLCRRHNSSRVRVYTLHSKTPHVRLQNPAVHLKSSQPTRPSLCQSCTNLGGVEPHHSEGYDWHCGGLSLLRDHTDHTKAQGVEGVFFCFKTSVLRFQAEGLHVRSLGLARCGLSALDLVFWFCRLGSFRIFEVLRKRTNSQPTGCRSRSFGECSGEVGGCMFQTPIPQPEVKPSQSFDPCLRQVLQVVQRPEYAEVAEEARPLQGFRSCSCGVWRCSDCGVSWLVVLGTTTTRLPGS